MSEKTQGKTGACVGDVVDSSGLDIVRKKSAFLIGHRTTSL